MYAGQRESEAITKEMAFTTSNFRIVKTDVQGTASCPYLFYFTAPHPMIAQILGFGNAGIALGNPDLYEQAMASLHEGHPIFEKSQQFHNVVEEWDVTSYFGVYAIVKLTLTADVVEFTGPKEK